MAFGYKYIQKAWGAREVVLKKVFVLDSFAFMKIWNHINNIGKGTSEGISDYVDKLESAKKFFFPNLRETDNVYLFSDYGGDLNHKLTCYSVLLMDEESVTYFISSFKEFWRDNFPDFRTIEYKSVSTDVYKKGALVPFLEFCNSLNGIVVSIIFHKSSKSIFQEEIPNELINDLNVWKDKNTREKFLRLRELILMLLNGLANKNQKFTWISDNDNIISNKMQITAANKIMYDTLNRHLGFDFAHFEIKGLEADLPEKPFKKLCSIPDLVAGTIVDFMEAYYKLGLTTDKAATYAPISHEKEKLNYITNWISKNESECSLKKITIEIKESADNSLQVGAFKFPTFYKHVSNFY